MKTKSDNREDEVTRDLVRGKYRNGYLVYCRKSTDEPNNQKNSLSYQREQVALFAHRHGLPVVDLTINGFCRAGVIAEKHSAFHDNDVMIVNDGGTVQFGVERPKFHRMVQHLSKGHFKGVIFLCWDRASRNSADSTILKKLRKRGVDLRFVLATYDESSSGELHIDIDDMFAEHHSRVTSEKVRLATLKSKRSGLCTYQAPVGYLNTGRMDSKPLDPDRAPIVKRMFELADEGWSLVDIARWSAEQGFTMPPRRRKRTKDEILLDEEDDNPSTTERTCRPAAYTTIQRILRDRFYVGMVRGENGAWTPSQSHEALVSPALFERVQEKLTSRNRSRRYKMPLAYPFRRIINCAGCGRAYTPYVKKGILYLACRCRDDCTNRNRNINFDFVSSHIEVATRRITWSSAELSEFDSKAAAVIERREHDRHDRVHDTERQRKGLREDLAYLRENKLQLLKSAVYSPEEYMAEERKLEGLLAGLTAGETRETDPPLRVALQHFKKLSELLKNVETIWNLAEPSQRESIARIIFSELRVSENSLQCKASPGFEPFETRFVSTCAPELWLSELSRHADSIEAAVHALSAALIVKAACTGTAQRDL